MKQTIRTKRNTSGNQVLMYWFGQYWFQILVSGMVVYLFTQREIQMTLVSPSETVQAGLGSMALSYTEMSGVDEPVAPRATLVSKNFVEDQPAYLPGQWNPADFQCISFVLDPDLAIRKRVDPAIVEAKRKECLSYIKRFQETAVEEMQASGIPASIILAQALLASDAGNHRLALESNNHFGIKCRNNCHGCTCRNYADDDTYELFRVFQTPRESFREHSRLLQQGPYQKLHAHKEKDYKKWAIGLKKAGYSTDRDYDRKIIRIIESLRLNRLDKTGQEMPG